MTMTLSKPLTLASLLQAAERAHRDGVRWADFWPTAEADARRLVAWDRWKYQRIVRLLLHVVVSGETSGEEPVGSGVTAWDSGDES